MAELIKAYSENGSTVFEVSVTAFSKQGAKARGFVSLLGRRPGQIPAVENVEVMTLDSGGLRDYRVIITIASEGDVRDVTKLDEAVDKIRQLL